METSSGLITRSGFVMPDAQITVTVTIDARLIVWLATLHTFDDPDYWRSKEDHQRFIESMARLDKALFEAL